jgi:hypothetical protein
MRRTLIRAAGVSAAAAALCTYAAVIRPRLATWGATPAEVGERLPGDDLIAEPATSTTRAITIRAPVDQVWPWLVQIGTDRGGWYTYDRLERLAGVPVRSTDEVRPGWQDLAEGDLVTLAPSGWMGVRDGFVMPVASLVPNECIVLRQEPPRSPWNGVWSFHLRHRADDSCRLLIRSRTEVAADVGPLLLAVAPVGELVTAVMEHGMLEGIKRRAERGNE